jgi:hypothetical protein
VVLTPDTASLAAGATQQFTASGKMSDGSTSPVTLAWSATGGTISSTGLYTAGQMAGTFQAIATQSGGALADTATVTVTTPESEPAPLIGATYQLATAETAGSIAPWEYAVAEGGNRQPSSSTDRRKTGLRSWKFERTVLTNSGAKVQFLDTAPKSSMGCASGHYCTGWYSWWTYVDAGYDQPGWNMLLGWMASSGGGSGMDPISSIWLTVVNGVLQVSYDSKSCEVGRFACPNIAGYTRVGAEWRMSSRSPSGIVPFPRGQWVHLSAYYKMAKTNGQIIIYQDGRKIMDLTHPTLNTMDGNIFYNNAARDMILQFGIYSGPRSRVQRLYVDDFAVTDFRPSP